MPPLTKTTRYTLNNGLTIPVNGFGMARLDDVPLVVQHALDVGYRHFDSAKMYGNEEEAAHAIVDYLSTHPSLKRSDVFYTTKIMDADHGYESATLAIQESLKKAEPLGYIDLFLIHSPQSNREKRLGTWRALQEAVDSGKVKSIGVSNYGIHHLEGLFNWEGLKIRPVINQVELHPWAPRTELCQYCKSQGILMEAFTPTTRGKKFDEPEVVKICEKHGCSPADVLIRWGFHQGFVMLVKSSNPERIEMNYGVLDRLELDEEDLKLLNKPESHELVGRSDRTQYKG